jgi:hypothetical protein
MEIEVYCPNPECEELWGTGELINPQDNRGLSHLTSITGPIMTALRTAGSAPIANPQFPPI